MSLLTLFQLNFGSAIPLPPEVLPGNAFTVPGRKTSFSIDRRITAFELSKRKQAFLL